MNSKQELIDAMNGEGSGQAPPAVFTQSATVSQMNNSGCRWPDAHFNAKSMAELSMQMSEMYGFAMAKLPFDVTVSEEALGCIIDAGSSTSVPRVKSSPWVGTNITDIPEFISIDEFIENRRCCTLFDAVEIVSKKNPDLFISTSLSDPICLSCSLLGMENLLMGAFNYPDKVIKWISSVTPYLSELANRLSEVSDNVMVLSESEEDILPPEYFGTLVRPYTSKVISSIGDSFSSLHVCGMTSNILEDLANLGEDALSVTTMSDPEGVMNRVGRKVKLMGGIDPTSDMLMGTSDMIVKHAKMYSDLGYSVIIPECGLDARTSDSNLFALSNYRCLDTTPEP